MPPIIQAKPVMYTVKDLLQTIKPREQATPFSGKRVHFVGIGGCGMSGLAQMLVNFGAHVSGTDRTPSSVTRKLSEIGASVVYEQTAASIPGRGRNCGLLGGDQAGARGTRRSPPPRLRNRQIRPDARAGDETTARHRHRRHSRQIDHHRHDRSCAALSRQRSFFCCRGNLSPARRFVALGRRRSLRR